MRKVTDRQTVEVDCAAEIVLKFQNIDADH